METNQLERYLTGQPLNEENASLMEGREPVTDLYGEAKAKEASSLTDEDRSWLRRLFHEPGFNIFLALLNSSIQQREDSAKLLSSTDPLGNRDQVANAWAYIACYRAIMMDIQLIADKVLRQDL